MFDHNFEDQHFFGTNKLLFIDPATVRWINLVGMLPTPPYPPRTLQRD